MEIKLYESWMQDQVVSLFVKEYNVDYKLFESFFSKFYESPFQSGKSIRIVALDNKTVAGFQSFFYWPYQYGYVIFNSYQSGNSLVHENYRGQGLFKKMLQYFDEVKNNYKVDFLVGFPVEASKNSFVKNGWDNILNLKWYVKYVSWLSFFNTKKTNAKFLKPEINDFSVSTNSRSKFLTLNDDLEFKNWRKEYFEDQNYLYFSYSNGNDSIFFECKPQTRKKIIKELVVGRIVTNTNDKVKLKYFFKQFLNEVRKNKIAFFVSVAINEKFESPINKTVRNSFNKTKKEIYFIVKNENVEIPINNPDLWELYRSDIDTW